MKKNATVDHNGKKLKSRLKRVMEEFGLDIKVKKKFKTNGVTCAFCIETIGKTKIQNIKDSLEDIKFRLKLQTLELQVRGKKLFLVASKECIISRNIIVILQGSEFAKAKLTMKVPFAVGCRASGELIIIDLCELPHLLLGGETKMGKTVSLKCLLICILSCCSPDKVKLIIYDGASELKEFYGFPHLIQAITQDHVDIYSSIMNLEQIVRERLSQKDTSFTHFYPMIFCVIDEFQSLIKKLPDWQVKKFTEAISYISTSGRHADIHLIITAHFPKKDNVGDCDLSNVPARIAFKCSSTAQSNSIVQNNNGTKLDRKGEMWLRISEDEQFRVQGAYISDQDLELVLNHMRSYWNRNEPVVTVYDTSSIVSDVSISDMQDYEDVYPSSATPIYDDNVNQPSICEDDKLFADIILWSLRFETVKIEGIKTDFKLGFNNARIYFHRLHEVGIIEKPRPKVATKVIPVVPSDLSPEVINFLNLAGYTFEDIRNAFSTVKECNDICTINEINF